MHYRDSSKLVAAKLFYIHIDKNKAASRKMLVSSLAEYYATYDVDAHTVFGPADECYGRLEEFKEAGVRTFILLPIDHSVRQLERIADMVSHF